MASTQVAQTAVANNSPSQHSNYPDDLFQLRYATPGFKPFSFDHFNQGIRKQVVLHPVTWQHENSFN